MSFDLKKFNLINFFYKNQTKPKIITGHGNNNNAERRHKSS